MSAPPARQPCFLKCSQGTDCIDDYYLPEWFCTGTEGSQPGQGEEAGVDRQAELYLPEWLSTEDGQPGEGEEAGVDHQAEIYLPEWLRTEDGQPGEGEEAGVDKSSYLPEWLRTEDGQLGEGEEAGVDHQAELYLPEWLRTEDGQPGEGEEARIDKSSYLPEWFCTEDSQPGEGEEAGVDRQAELNRQLRRHHTRQDQGALQEQLVTIPVGKALRYTVCYVLNQLTGQTVTECRNSEEKGTKKLTNRG